MTDDFEPKPGRLGRYAQTIETLFLRKFTVGAKRVAFNRDEFNHVATELGFSPIKNLGDIVYSFRYRATLPSAITTRAPAGLEWVILGVGDAAYEFRLAYPAKLSPSKYRTEIKIPDATPEILRLYAPGMDEQALLTKVRYNRIIDVFTGFTCYSIQNHYRTKVPSIGQIEVDEIYIGVSKNGTHYVLPCQAKSPKDSFGFAQAYQDSVLCSYKYPHAICRPIGLQFKSPDTLAVIQISIQEVDDVFHMTISDERHYRLVAHSAISATDLAQYVD